MMLDFLVDVEIANTQSIDLSKYPAICDLGEFLTIHLNGTLLRPGFDCYKIEADRLYFDREKGASLVPGDLVVVSGFIDLGLFLTFSNLPKREVAVWLTSEDSKLRQLGQLRARLYQDEEERIRKLIKEELKNVKSI